MFCGAMILEAERTMGGANFLYFIMTWFRLK